MKLNLESHFYPTFLFVFHLALISMIVDLLEGLTNKTSDERQSFVLIMFS